MAMRVMATLLAAGVRGLSSSSTAMSVSESGRPDSYGVEREMPPQGDYDDDYRPPEQWEQDDPHQVNLREQEVASLAEQDLHVDRTDSLQLIPDGAVSRDAVEAPPPRAAQYDSFSFVEASSGSASSGAPSDGYTPCGSEGDDCECQDGEVRWGSRDDNVWTMPTKIGETKSVKCKLSDIREKRVHYEVEDGNEEPLGCQCIERTIQISVDMGLKANEKSLMESEAADIATLMEMEAKGGHHKCLTLGSGGSLIEETDDSEYGSMIEERTRGGGEVVEVMECDDKDENQEWTYVLSTGQIRHQKTGKCMAVDYTGSAKKDVHMHACTDVENQEHVQRWEAPMYIMPKFKIGEGVVRLGYGAHTERAVCIMTAGDTVYTELCTAPEISEWRFKAIDINGHNWKACGAEGETCSCPDGEVRYGDGEKNDWTPGVFVKSSIKCGLPNLQGESLKNAKASGGDCECRHDLVMDGNGDAAQTKKIKEAEDEEEDAKGGSPIGMIVGIAVVLGLVSAGAVVVLKKPADDHLLGEEHEGEYEEEEEEEEYEE